MDSTGSSCAGLEDVSVLLRCTTRPVEHVAFMDSAGYFYFFLQMIMIGRLCDVLTGNGFLKRDFFFKNVQDLLAVFSSHECDGLIYLHHLLPGIDSLLWGFASLGFFVEKRFRKFYKGEARLLKWI